MGRRERRCVVRLFRVVRLVLVVGVRAVVGAAALVLDGQVEAQHLHAALDELADGPLRAVAHARVQLLALGHLAHVCDHVPARVRANRAAEKFPAVVQVVVHGRAALLVALALAPSLRAAGAGSPGQARLDGPLGPCALLVVGAAAVLQRRAVLGQVELDQRRNAVARALLLLAAEHGPARATVVLVRVIALGLGLAVHDGLPAYEPPAVGRRGHGRVAEEQQQAAEKPE